MVYNIIKLYGENSLQSSYADTVGITTFDSTEQQGFITYLPDATSATVTEEINGQFDLVMTYPVSGDGYKDILVNRIIACKPNPHSSIQAFRIYKISKPIDGIVEITANHISYDLNGYLLNPFETSGTPNAVITEIGNHSATECPFTFSSDVNKMVSKFAVSKPVSIREMLGGKLSNELSLIQTCSGEFEFDNLNVALKEHRGSDNGVKISYGKNLTEFRFDEDSSPFYTGVYPYWTTSKKPENSESNNNNQSQVVVAGGGTQTFTATAQYGNMNLFLDVSIDSAGRATWNLYFKIVVVGGYHFRYQNSCEVVIGGVKVFSTANIGEIDINGLSVNSAVPLSSGTTQRPIIIDGTKSVPVSATFIQRQDLRGTWRISGNYTYDGTGVEVVTNVDTDDIYYCVTLDGNNKIHNYSTDSKTKKLYTLDLSKEIEIPKDSKGNYIYPDNTEAGQQARANIRSQLNTAFQKYLSENEDPTVFSDSLEVSFVDLAQSDEYSDYVGLETVNIGDVVTVEYSAYNISKSKECVKTEYDVLSDSYITLTLGELTDTLASTIQNGTSLAQRNTVNAEQLKNAVNQNFNHINALTIDVGTIQADYIVVNQRITANEANITTLSATKANIDFANINSAAISNLTAHSAFVDYLSASSAFISYLTANEAWVSYLNASSAVINNLTANSAWINYVSANSVFASYLVANSAVIGSLSAYFAFVDFANIGSAAISNLFAKSAFVNVLNASYADISFARIGSVDAQTLVLKTGYIEEVTISGATVTNLASIVNLNADYINAGTLNADRIRLRGENGLYYLLNISADGSVVPTDPTEKAKLEGGIDGMIIIAQSITANKISVTDLSAFNATIANLVLESGSIHTVNKTSPDNTTTGIFISSNSFAIGGSRHYLRYWRDTDDNTWKLEIKGLITANEGSIAGWSIESNLLSKETSIDPTIVIGTQTQYKAGISAPSSPGSNNRAFYLRSRTTTDGGQTYSEWDDLFAVFYNGKLVAQNAEIEGKIVATSGTVGGWDISSAIIDKYTNGKPEGTAADGTVTRRMYLQPTGTNAIGLIEWIYSTSDAEWVRSNKFIVSWAGKLTAIDAEITGKVTATSGYIGGSGGWVITTGKIYKGTAGSASGIFLDATGSTSATIAGAAHSNLMLGIGSRFGVDKNGYLYATGVTISGSITATSGTFTGTITSSDATITGGTITITGNSAHQNVKISGDGLQCGPIVTNNYVQIHGAMTLSGTRQYIGILKSGSTTYYISYASLPSSGNGVTLQIYRP